MIHFELDKQHGFQMKPKAGFLKNYSRETKQEKRRQKLPISGRHGCYKPYRYFKGKWKCYFML
jgi:hypothetical protein